MNFIVYIQIKPLEKVSFGNPLTQWLKSSAHEIMILDADNHSDNLVIDQEIKLLAEADKVALILDVTPEAAPGKTVLLIEKLLRKKGLSLLVLKEGSNQFIDNMLRLSQVQVEPLPEQGALQLKLADFLKA